MFLGVSEEVCQTCHTAVFEPFWCLSAATGKMWYNVVMMELEIWAVDGKRLWPIFAPHHYLSEGFSGHRSFVCAFEDGGLVGFTSSMRLPHAHIVDGWRAHRTVILPDFQGLGLGVALNEWLAEWHIQQGHRFYSRTTHPRLGEHRNRSPLWKATGKNQKLLTGTALESSGIRNPEDGRKFVWKADGKRIAYAHEYIGHRETEI